MLTELEGKVAFVSQTIAVNLSMSGISLELGRVFRFIGAPFPVPTKGNFPAVGHLGLARIQRGDVGFASRNNDSGGLQAVEMGY